MYIRTAREYFAAAPRKVLLCSLLLPMTYKAPVCLFAMPEYCPRCPITLIQVSAGRCIIRCIGFSSARWVRNPYLARRFQRRLYVVLHGHGRWRPDQVDPRLTWRLILPPINDLLFGDAFAALLILPMIRAPHPPVLISSPQGMPACHNAIRRTNSLGH